MFWLVFLSINSNLCLHAYCVYVCTVCTVFTVCTLCPPYIIEKHCLSRYTKDMKSFLLRTALLPLADGGIWHSVRPIFPVSSFVLSSGFIFLIIDDRIVWETASLLYLQKLLFFMIKWWDSDLVMGKVCLKWALEFTDCKILLLFLSFTHESLYICNSLAFVIFKRLREVQTRMRFKKKSNDCPQP